MHRVIALVGRIVDLPFKVAAIGLITLYRYTLSAFAGRTCRHLPTCSEYTAEAIWTFGFWPGGWMGLARFSRCRPGGTHGYDPVPEALPPEAHWYAPWRYGRWKAGNAAAPQRKRTDTASRLIKASPERVYAALVDPEALVEWLPPKGMTARLEAWDMREGGRYRMVLGYGDVSAARPKSAAGADIVEGRFVELVPGRRVVQAVDFVSDDPAFAGTMTMRWLLEPAGEGTQLTILAEDVPAGISAEDHDAGLRVSLENLALHLDRAPPAIG